MKIEEVISSALELPPQSRAFIAERLLESIDSESGENLSPEWQAEIAKRVSELGNISLKGADDVFAHAYKNLS